MRDCLDNDDVRVSFGMASPPSVDAGLPVADFQRDVRMSRESLRPRPDFAPPTPWKADAMFCFLENAQTQKAIQQRGPKSRVAFAYGALPLFGDISP